MNIASCELHTKKLNTMYLRGELKSRIVHLCFGAFHLAHQALITHEMLSQHVGDLGIC